MRVVAFPAPGTRDYWFNPAENNWHKAAWKLRDMLIEAGHEIDVFPCDVRDDDVGLYFNHFKQIPQTGKKILIQQEPPVVDPYPYPMIQALPYDRILTFCRPYVDNKKIHFLHFPTPSYDGDLSGVKRNKYICAISSNKRSDHPEQLYTARRLAYLSFGKDIDVYGYGWEKDEEIMRVCNYKGVVEDKVKTLAQYKFAIVFENQNIHGWNSEKIYHCLQAKTTPIYRGSMEDFLPLDEVTEDKWAKAVLNHIEEVIGGPG
jgi:hypothetical protein